MMKYTSVFSALLIGASVAVTASAFAPAQAISITTAPGAGGNPSGQTLYQAEISKANDIGKTFEIDWYLATGTYPPNTLTQPLSATSTWTIVNFTNNALTLQISLTNTTPTTPNDINARLTSYAFGVNPEATSIDFSDGSNTDTDAFGEARLNPNPTIPSFNQVDIDVCFIAGNNCAGGGGGGLLSGQTDVMNLTVNGNFTDDKAFLQFFAARFQTGEGSYVLAGKPGEPVPEPITMLGLGVGTAGLGALKRKYGNKEAKAKVAV
ncbi:cistern family PEP-CTERM protein [Anabaena subtropica]|uniref:Cistern family PEP-CTERM protein n=1 Tax=Anabaena subtropica FACHB-260 TaxID=2692884 RepID=A0ABR8CSX7_9NOST|nr:cistern family PEP-CTERM protein [Anabaena subtropica]MBD2345468.1 cistern family PEP-CTERM protein [Anabaena subtropica FACHB-260]